MQRLANKVAIVTGGGGRIGAATAKRFAAEGAKVVIADLSEEGAERVATEIGDAALAVRFDAGDVESIARLVQRTVDHFGGLDILHNNAALLDLEFLNRDRTVVDTEASRVSRRLLSVRRSYNEQRKEQVFT